MTRIWAVCTTNLNGFVCREQSLPMLDKPDFPDEKIRDMDKVELSNCKKSVVYANLQSTTYNLQLG